MLKYFFIAWAIIAQLNSIWAQSKFNITINNGQYGDIGTKMHETTNDFLCTGTSWYANERTGYLEWKPTFIKIDKQNGTLIENKSIVFDSLVSHFARKTYVVNGKYIVIGEWQDSINQGENRRENCIFWLDENLNEIRRKIWGNPNGDDYLVDLIPMSNGDFIVLGHNNYTDPYGQIHLYRLDSLGNIIWQTTFGQIGKQEEGISMEVIGNSIYISGFYINRSIEYIRSFVYKYNTNGDFIATSIYPVEYYNGCSRIKQISSNKFVLSGSVGYNWTNYSDALQIYIDSSLNKINHTIINPIDTLRQSFFDATYYDAERGLLLNAYLHYRTQFGGSPLSGVIATDTAGNIRWQQEYYTRTDAPQYLYDIQKTSDGGYIMCGSAIPNTPNPTQDFWVIKTDSVGCVVHCITGIDNSPSAEAQPEIQVFPNPINDVLHIIAPENIRTISIYNAQGQVMYQQVVTLENNHVLITIPHYPSGIYLIEIEDEKKQKYNKKILKQ